jgi:hypothetical protein
MLQIAIERRYRVSLACINVGNKRRLMAEAPRND